ncbi:ethanolamine transporter [Salinibacillus kushneri]|uniref:Ethanolamine transporter n=1 Tax=Salinibacillus kushneri TaxID=237682 RepID=A0A1I0DUY0_9BACI|nr:ethanolamine utilization protein EutH [Salinibacillus kushneri]SET36282.1 ethanolamine transporter [Salinibacillus kushneri]
MGINDIIVIIVVCFLMLGAVDHIMGNKYGYGKQFTDGFMAMGTLTLAMVGIISLAPVVTKILTPVITPIYTFIGADPASFVNSLLALDMGGYALAQEMSLTHEAELFAWVFLGTMLGPTIVFTIPVALGIIRKEDHAVFAKGILIGIITIPIGSFTGATVAGLNMSMILQNLLPAVILSLFIAIGLWKRTNQMIRGFKVFGELIKIMAIVGLTAVAVETMTGYVIIPNMIPISEGFQIVGTIALFLAGAFPMVTFLQRVLKKPLEKFGHILGVNDTSTAGLISSFAHHIPMFMILKDMDERGKVVNVAFAVSGAFVFGGHLGFVAGIEKEMVFAMIVGKLTGGITAIILALLVMRKQTE